VGARRTSNERTELFEEARRLLALGAPAAATQLGAMLLGVVDTMMVGHLGVLELDAAALGSLWSFGTMVIGMGVILGMDSIVARAHGADQPQRVAIALHHGTLLAILCSIPIAASWLATEQVLLALGQRAELAAAAHAYVLPQLPSVAPFLMFCALRQYLQGRGMVTPALGVMLLANGLNALGNYWLIWGGLGVPALGLQGAAIATSVTRSFLFVGLLAWMLQAGLHRGAWVRPSWASIASPGLGRMLALGLPIGVQLGLEVWAFQASTLLAGRLGEIELAAHVAVLNLASLSFMIPMGISIGASTRVGHLLGRGDRIGARRSAKIALALGAGVMAISAASFAIGRHALPRFYTDDPAVLAMAASILPIAAAFQLFDGTQVVGGGVLRGMGATGPAALFNAIGYYALALPVGWWLTDTLGLGLAGLWWGLCLGLAAVAAALVVWIFRRPGSSGLADTPSPE
jgi:multidrug resistance protein, MATE family